VLNDQALVTENMMKKRPVYIRQKARWKFPETKQDIEALPAIPCEDGED